MHRLLLPCLLCLPGLTVVARPAAADATICAGERSCTPPLLEEVVVTATRTSTSVFRSPLTLSLIDASQIEHSTADGVADMLRDVPGVSISDSGEAGMKRVRFRGEESRRVAVLIDGQELTDHREVGVPLLIDPDLVERIEVVRGPASVLYGAKALSGVLNIITRKGGDRPLEGSVSTTWDSATDGWHESISAFGASRGLSYRAFAARNRQGERETPAGTIENTRYESDSLSLHVARELRSGYLAVSHDRERASSEVYVAPEVRFTPPFLDFALDVPQRDRTRSAVFYEHSGQGGVLARVQLSGYHQIGERQFNTASEMLISYPPPGMNISSEIFTHSRLTTDGALTQLDWHPSDNHYVVTGIEYNRDEVTQGRLKNTSVNGAPPATQKIHDLARITTWALFLQDEWTIAETWSLIAGLRGYRVRAGLGRTDRPLLEARERSDSHVVRSVSLLHELSPRTLLRATLAEGYVYPSLLQLATGAYAGSRFINPRPDLKPETSLNLEFGLRHQGEFATLDGTLFTSRAEDYIDHIACRTEDNCLTPADETYRNVGSSRAFGLEVTTVFHLHQAPAPYLDLTWYRRRNEFDRAHTWQTGIPLVSATAGLRHGITRGRVTVTGDLYARYEARAEALDITKPGAGVVSNDGWYTLNGRLGFDFAGPFRLDLALHNLTNRKYTTATENLWGAKRSIQAKLALAL